MQHDGDYTASRYFYLHDRLGSVRLIVDESGTVQNSYTYNPFGELFATETAENISNSFKFTGQWYDSEIGQYYLRARMYDPQLMRFTARDPERGKLKEPLTLHKYLYCQNDPINHIDPKGRSVWGQLSAITTGAALYNHGLELAAYATYSDENWDFFDLADATFKFMPVGMAVAYGGVGTWPGRVTGIIVGIGIEEFTHITGMGRLEGGAMDYWAYLLYGSYMLNEQAEAGVWPWDMADFTRWHDY